ncbi:MAG: NHL repeat-containing protein, partial [candidate division KSB1 bacterium]|nr:NHL repeat-containing protein [candidate division KSB1 bacterium]
MRLLQRLLLVWLSLYFSSNGVRGIDKNKDDPTTLVFPAFLHTLGIRKATKFHLFLFMGNRVKFRDPQGLAVVRLESWEDTTKTSDDDEVTVYGVNSGQDNIIFNTSMTSLGVYGLTEQGDQRLNKPRGIAANARGDVYVADTGNHRVVRLFNPGRSLKFVGSIGRRGNKKGEFQAPRGVALDSRGNLYVSDTGNNRIQIFDNQNHFIRAFGSSHRLIEPDGIAVMDSGERWSFYQDEFIIVVDSANQRLQKFSLEGNYLTAITARQFGYPKAYLAYVAVDYYSNVYVTDTANHCIHKFDRGLNYLTTFGRYGSGDKEFMEPRGITIYRRFGQTFVAEKEGAQYYWIGTDILDFKTSYDSKNKRVQIEYFLTEPAFVTLDIY